MLRILTNGGEKWDELELGRESEPKEMEKSEDGSGWKKKIKVVENVG